MKVYIKELLISLCDIMTVSGFEDTEENKLISLISPYFDKHEKTKTGSYIFTKLGTKENSETILLDAHIDQIGFMISKICDNGFLKFSPVGGIDTRILPGADVKIHGKEVVSGVISSRAPHLMSEKEAGENPNIEKLYIDTGLSKEYIEENIRIGTPASFNFPTTELLNNKISACGLDNKASIAIALAAIKMLGEAPIDYNIVLMLSTREELGGPGAVTGAFPIMPKYAIVLDVNLAFMPENPGVDTDMFRHTVEIGEGPAISLSATTNRNLTRRLIKIADECEIPHQEIAEASSTGTNADKLALVGVGIPCAVLGVPLANMHTYSELISIDDVISSAKLIYNFLLDCKGEKDE